MAKNWLWIGCIALISCQNGKDVDSIEAEYGVQKTSSNNASSNNHSTSNNNGSEEKTKVPAKSFEYLEDFATIRSKKELYATFGAEHLEDGISWYAEGTVEFQHTLLTDPNTGNVYTYVWMEEDNETLSFIEANLFIWDDNYEIARKQIVLSKTGLFTGMTLKELFEWNGEKDFKFYGFGWDYEGTISPGTGSNMVASGLGLQLTLENYSNQDWTHLLGDIELSTEDHSLFEAPIVLGQLTIYPEKTI